MADLDFLLVQCLAGLGQSEFQVADLGPCGSHPQRHAELQPGLPTVEVAVGECAVGTAIHPFGLAEQVVTVAVDVVTGDDIELGASQAACGGQLELQALDRPFLTSQFDPPGQSVDQAALPVGAVSRGDRFVGRTDDAAVVDRQSDETAESGFGGVEVGSSSLGTTLDLEIVVPRLGLFGGRPAGIALDHSPGLFGTVQCDLLGVVDAIGQVEVPVQVLDVLDQVADGRLEIIQGDVVVDPRDHHTLVDPDD